MKPLSGAVDRALQALGLRDDVARAEAIDAWPEAAAAVLGVLAGSTRAVRTDGETLIVLAPTSSHAAEIRLRESEIIAAIARIAPASGIRRLRCAPDGRIER